jgi:hypothetical protein
MGGEGFRWCANNIRLISSARVISFSGSSSWEASLHNSSKWARSSGDIETPVGGGYTRIKTNQQLRSCGGRRFLRRVKKQPKTIMVVANLRGVAIRHGPKPSGGATSRRGNSIRHWTSTRRASESRPPILADTTGQGLPRLMELKDSGLPLKLGPAFDQRRENTAGRSIRFVDEILPNLSPFNLLRCLR